MGGTGCQMRMLHDVKPRCKERMEKAAILCVFSCTLNLVANMILNISLICVIIVMDVPPVLALR